MKLAAKIYYRLKREFRDACSFIRSVVLKRRIEREFITQSWRSPDQRQMSFEDCTRDWMIKYPVVLHQDLNTCPEDLTISQRILKTGVVTIFGNDASLLCENLWHQDFLSGERWPKDIHYSQFCVQHPSRDGRTDIRRLWELARFAWGVSMAKAYKSDGNVEYLKLWQQKVESFIDQNPPEFGPHWLNAMEPAMRAIQWVRAYSIFRKSGAFEPSGKDLIFHEKLLISLIEHGEYVRRHLEWTHLGRTNHYLSNLAGLLAISVVLPQWKEADEWKELSIRELSREIERQTDKDGFHAEASTAYHHFVTELYTFVSALDREHSLGFSSRFHGCVREMIRVDQQIRGAANLDPRIGDDDSSFVLQSFPAGPDLLSSFFPWKSHLKPEQMSNSFALNASGIFCLREKEISCFVTCGPNGQEGVGGHAHNDKLSLVISYKGKPLIVDAGTYSYSGNIAMRDRFRATASHNTVQINDLEQNELSDWRALRDRTQAHLLQWVDSADECLFSGEHRGFASVGCTHRRTIKLVKVKQRLEILDEIFTSSNYAVVLRLHLAPECKAENVRISKNSVILDSVEIIFPDTITIEIEPSKYSPLYGQLTDNAVLSIKAKSQGNFKLPWEIRFKS